MRMKFLYKILLLAFALIFLAVFNRIGGMETAILLLLTGLNILKDKYFDNDIMRTLIIVASLAGVYVHPVLFAATCAIVMDLAFAGKNKTAALSFLISFLVLGYAGRFDNQTVKFWILACFAFFSAVSAIIGLILSDAQKNRKNHTDMLDEERRLRYELEATKSKLISSTREATRLAEAGERNRIAREIHDNVGHSISGILIQLQAASRLLERDRNDENAGRIIQTCIENLSGTVTTLRQTVHNIKPKELLGFDYIKSIIDAFTYCRVDFEFSGDINRIQPEYLEIMATTLKEALTNISKHSNAAKVIVSINANSQFVRLLIKDDGKGCKSVHEGLGLSGMRERVRGVGGTFSYGPSDESFGAHEGFMIVCVLVKPYVGGERT